MYVHSSTGTFVFPESRNPGDPSMVRHSTRSQRTVTTSLGAVWSTEVLSSRNKRGSKSPAFRL